MVFVAQFQKFRSRCCDVFQPALVVGRARASEIEHIQP